MESRNTIIGLIILLAIIAGAWYWYEQSSAASSAAAVGPSAQAGTNGSANQGNLGQTDTGTPQQPQGDGTDVTQNLTLGTSVDAKLGTILTAYNGMTLYAFARDTKNTSNCTGTCASNWPPYTVPSVSALHLPASLSGTLGTTARADGTLQVTYNGTPLYFYVKDATVGDTTGEGVGGVWTVVRP